MFTTQNWTLLYTSSSVFEKDVTFGFRCLSDLSGELVPRRIDMIGLGPEVATTASVSWPTNLAALLLSQAGQKSVPFGEFSWESTNPSAPFDDHQRTPWIIVFVQTVPKRYIYDEKDIQPLTNYVRDLRPFDVHHWSGYSKRSIQMPEALRLLLVSGMGAALNHLVWTYLCRTRIHQFTPINDFVFCW